MTSRKVLKPGEVKPPHPKPIQGLSFDTKVTVLKALSKNHQGMEHGVFKRAVDDSFTWANIYEELCNETFKERKLKDFLKIEDFFYILTGEKASRAKLAKTHIPYAEDERYQPSGSEDPAIEPDEDRELSIELCQFHLFDYFLEDLDLVLNELSAEWKSAKSKISSLRIKDITNSLFEEWGANDFYNKKDHFEVVNEMVSRTAKYLGYKIIR